MPPPAVRPRWANAREVSGNALTPAAGAETLPGAAPGSRTDGEFIPLLAHFARRRLFDRLLVADQIGQRAGATAQVRAVGEYYRLKKARTAGRGARGAPPVGVHDAVQRHRKLRALQAPEAREVRFVVGLVLFVIRISSSSLNNTPVPFEEKPAFGNEASVCRHENGKKSALPLLNPCYFSFAMT